MRAGLALRRPEYLEDRQDACSSSDRIDATTAGRRRREKTCTALVRACRTGSPTNILVRQTCVLKGRAAVSHDGVDDHMHLLPGSGSGSRSVRRGTSETVRRGKWAATVSDAG
jgi:hypothetical protein